MTHLLAIGLFAWALTIACVLRADEKPSPEYVEAMTTLAAVSEELPRRLAAEDASGLDKLIIKARPALATLEQYWTARKVDEALELAQAASKAIAEISVAVHLMSDGPNPIAVEGAQDSIRTFQASCVSCHAKFRATLPDGSYAIR